MNLSFKHRPLQFDLMKYRIVLIKIKFLKSMDIFYCIDYNGVRNNFKKKNNQIFRSDSST